MSSFSVIGVQNLTECAGRSISLDPVDVSVGSHPRPRMVADALGGSVSLLDLTPGMS